MKTLVTIIAGLVLSTSARFASAYLVPNLPYEKLFARSDLMVIARPVSSRDTSERTVIRDVNPPVPVVGVTTEFQVLFVFKGAKRQRFKLHHYRERVRPKVVVIGGLPGISFDPPKNKRYLMFLVRESDGRFAPVLGQTHVVDISVQEVLGTSSD